MELTEKEQFVLDYLKTQNICVSVLDEDFHEQFFNKFGGKRKERIWGAQPVEKAMKVISKMYKNGLLDRGKTSIYDMGGYGFPKWIYTYNLPTLLEDFRLNK